MSDAAAFALLKEALQLFNDTPNFTLRGDRRVSSYELASRIEAYLSATAAAPFHPAVSIARQRWKTSFLRVSENAAVVEETPEAFWVAAEVMISRAAVGDIPDDLRARYDAALAQLPELTRRAFLLHRLDGLSYARISIRLAMSTAEVERHIADAIFGIGRFLGDD